MTPTAIVRRILDAQLDRAIHAYGLADLRGLLADPFALYPSGISILRRLDDTIVDGIAGGPTHEYLAHYREVNRELAGLSERVAAALAGEGLPAVAIPPSIRVAELDGRQRATLTCPVSHKMVATRAGLGWIGKTDLLVSLRFGARVRLVSVLVDAPLDTGTPIDESRCGACRVCVEACPPHAATGATWRAGVTRESFFDAFLCREHCRRAGSERLGRDAALCGLCVNVCPRGRTAMS